MKFQTLCAGLTGAHLYEWGGGEKPCVVSQYVGS